MKARRSSCGGAGFTLRELAVVICVVALLLAVFLIPALTAAKIKRSRINCVNNLRQIGLAFRIWEGDNNDKYPMQLAVTNVALMKVVSNGNAYLLWQTMSNELSTPKVLACPADKQRTAAGSFTQNFSDANISYFLSLDANGAYPQMMLCGDDNLTVNGVRVQPGILSLWTNTSLGWTQERHGGVGNVALADGSVQTATSAALQEAFQSAQEASQAAQTTANRLVIP